MCSWKTLADWFAFCQWWLNEYVATCPLFRHIISYTQIICKKLLRWFFAFVFFLRNIRRTTHFPKSLIVQILENTCYIRNTVLYLESVLKRRVMFIRQTCHWEKASMCLLLHTSSWPIVDIEFRIHESATKKEPQQWPRKVARIHKKREILAIYVTSIRLHFVFSNLKLMKQWCSIVCCIVNIAC